MAKPLPLKPPIYRIPFTPIKIEPVITKPCGNPKCSHTISTHDGFEYIHSKANGNFYCDSPCLASAEGIRINWDSYSNPRLRYQIESMLKEYDVDEY